MEKIHDSPEGRVIEHCAGDKVLVRLVISSDSILYWINPEFQAEMKRKLEFLDQGGDIDFFDTLENPENQNKRG